MSDPHYSLRLIRGEEELRSAREIRLEVFVREQGIPEELEIDCRDEQALHALAFDGSRPVATGRIVLAGSLGELERIAVRHPYRGRGIGAAVVRFLEEEGRQRGARRFELSPHRHLERFYARLGYGKIGEAGEIAGHPLIRMAKDETRRENSPSS